MSADNLDVFVPVIIMMALAIIIYGLALGVSALIAPKKYSKQKDMPYECGEEPVGNAWSMFNVRFYVVGLIFIIFDVESVLMFPIVSVFKKLNELGHGVYLLDVLLSFIFILVMGIAYCWRKGDLDWIKSFNRKTTKADQ
ncbi:MAG: NADH-quinone oxidoreductase subunit A [Halobacteriovoraceae bacterium]|nr:NADH-quinone oxidoreductase subunit A [Halobacteriovoraceae bacterium]